MTKKILEDESANSNDGEADNTVDRNYMEERLNRLEQYIYAIAEPVIKKKNPNKSRFERLADNLEGNPLPRIFISIGAVLAIFSFFGVVATAFGIWFQYKVIQEERIARAWTSLSNTGSGNNGKASSIQLLADQGEKLVGVDLGASEKASGSYIGPLVLGKIAIERPNLNFSEIDNLQSDGTLFNWAKANDVFLTGVLQNTEFRNSELISATFGLQFLSSVKFNYSLMDQFEIHPDYFSSANPYNDIQAIFDFELEDQPLSKFPQMYFVNTSLRCAILDFIPMTSFKFDDVNISGSSFDFDSFESMPEDDWENLKGAWYFSDNPPTGILSDKMEKFLEVKDRNKHLNECRIKEPWAFKKDPLINVSGVRGVSLSCVSIARTPNKCSSKFLD